MKCSTHIVECLRHKSIEPEAFASSYHSDPYKPSNAIEYNDSLIFSTPDANCNQWWAINFRRLVTIDSYQIKAPESKTSSSAIYEWNFSVSFDNETWRIVDYPPKGSPGDKIFKLRSSVDAFFVRINGRSQMTGMNYKIHFNYIKFFGSITTLKELRKYSCKSTRVLSYSFNQILFLISI